MVGPAAGVDAQARRRTTCGRSTAGFARRSPPTSRGTRFVRELTTAQGRSTENGAVNYFVIHRNQIDLTENYTQAFLGLTLTCARCHNHPMEKWTQRDYYAFANLFSRVSIKDDGGAKADATLRRVDRRRARSGIRAPARCSPPTPLDGTPMPRTSARRGSPRVSRALADRARQPALRAHGRQPRVGELLRPRPGAPGRRPARHQSGVERRAVRRR